ncbi:VOC family protein [Leucobacter sp. CSA1]|uniref:VOC family protein n=1 Tax=Leucobacter chromiisoli TaxID=2796471 RepID=A0A934Q8S7_9MICO|nr:VOC family protein [Leucobacter chromiisoli]MBK0418917.1 VOC family protein [Leucobacter chromiisoli]
MTRRQTTGSAGEGGLLRTWEQHHTGIVVADLDRDLEFYRTVLGYELTFMVRGMDDLYRRTVGVPGVSCDLAQLDNRATGTRIELIQVHDLPAGTDPSLPVHVGVAHTAYLVADIAAAAETIRAAGGEILGEIVEFEEGPAAYFRTAGGTVVELEEHRNPSKEEGEDAVHIS